MRSVLILLLLLSPAPALPESLTEQKVLVGILDFKDLTSDISKNWVGRAVSDLVLRELINNPKLDFISREKLTEVEQELEFGSSGFSKAVKHGDLELNYILNGTVKDSTDGKVSVHYGILLLGKKEGQFSCETSATLADLSKIADSISNHIKEIISGKIPSCGKELPDGQSGLTVADASFYRGLKLYENGKYADAQAQMVLAEKAAPGKEETLLFAAKIDQELGESEHAAVQLKDALNKNLTPRYNFHLRLLLSEIYSEYLNQPELAKAVILPLMSAPSTPYEKALFSFKLASTLLALGEYKEAYDRFYQLQLTLFDLLRQRQFVKLDEALSPDLRIPYSSIQFPSVYFIMEKSREGFRQAFLQSTYAKREDLKPVSGIVRLTQRSDDMPPPGSKLPHLKGETVGESLFQDENPALDKLIVADPELYFGKVTLTLNTTQGKGWAGIYAYQEEMSPNFSSPQYHCNLEVKNNTEKTECDLSLFNTRSILVHARSSVAAKWKVEYELIPKDKKRGFVWKSRYDGLLSENLIFPKFIPTSKMASHLSIFITKKNEFLIVHDSFPPMETDNPDQSDLFITSGTADFNFTPTARMENLSSPVADIYPQLLEDEAKNPIIIFASNRSGRFRIWMSRSKNSGRWTSPIMLRLGEKKEVPNYLSLSAILDSNGAYQLLLYNKDSGSFELTTSSDLSTWSNPVQLGKTIPAGVYPSGDIFQDNSGVFHAALSAPHWANYPMEIGSSLDGVKWTFKPASFLGNDFPRFGQSQSGILALIYGGGVVGKGLRQTVSVDKSNWSEGTVFPNSELCSAMSSTYYANADLQTLRSGKIVMASRGYHSSVIGFYLLDNLPVTDVFQAWKLSDSTPRHLKLHLRRDEIYGSYYKSREDEAK